MDDQATDLSALELSEEELGTVFGGYEDSQQACAQMDTASAM